MPIIDVFIVVGVQVPDIPGILVEIKGNEVADEFWQKGPSVLKLGAIELVTVIVPEVVTV